MNIEKTGNTTQVRQDAAAAAQRRAEQAQQDQEKQAQEAKKAQEQNQGSALKGDEINITA